jgi:hypothetical protein
VPCEQYQSALRVISYELCLAAVQGRDASDATRGCATLLGQQQRRPLSTRHYRRTAPKKGPLVCGERPKSREETPKEGNEARADRRPRRATDLDPPNARAGVRDATDWKAGSRDRIRTGDLLGMSQAS